jgi:hypothetical protein
VAGGEEKVCRADPTEEARSTAGRQEGVGDLRQCQALVGWQRYPALEEALGEVDVEGIGIGDGGLDLGDETGEKRGGVRPLPLEADPTAQVAPGFAQLVVCDVDSEGSEQEKEAEQAEKGCAKDDLVTHEVDGESVEQEKCAEQAKEGCAEDE